METGSGHPRPERRTKRGRRTAGLRQVRPAWSEFRSEATSRAGSSASRVEDRTKTGQKLRIHVSARLFHVIPAPAHLPGRVGADTQIAQSGAPGPVALSSEAPKVVPEALCNQGACLGKLPNQSLHGEGLPGEPSNQSAGNPNSIQPGRRARNTVQSGPGGGHAPNPCRGSFSAGSGAGGLPRAARG